MKQHFGVWNQEWAIQDYAFNGICPSDVVEVTDLFCGFKIRAVKLNQNPNRRRVRWRRHHHCDRTTTVYYYVADGEK